MPIKLIPPREGKSPNWSIRGTYLGCYVDRSAGTSDKAIAAKLLKSTKREIESGAVTKSTGTGGTGFAEAAATYMKAGGDARFLAPIIAHFKHTPLDKIDQVAVDHAAATLRPNTTASTRNRAIYTPIMAVLRRAGVMRSFKRPIGARTPGRIYWLKPEEAFAVFAEADKIEAEFGLLLRVLCYTGMRINEALGTRLAELDLSGASIYLPKTKNGDGRRVHLPPEIVAALANHPRGLRRPRSERLFRFDYTPAIRWRLDRAFKNAGLHFPTGVGFHVFRHTWATWMTRYANMDTTKLLATGAWRDRTMAARYVHLDATVEAAKANLLPTMKLAG